MLSFLSLNYFFQAFLSSSLVRDEVHKHDRHSPVELFSEGYNCLWKFTVFLVTCLSKILGCTECIVNRTLKGIESGATTPFAPRLLAEHTWCKDFIVWFYSLWWCLICLAQSNGRLKQGCAMEALQFWKDEILSSHSSEHVNPYSNIFEGTFCVESKP